MQRKHQYIILFFNFLFFFPLLLAIPSPQHPPILDLQSSPDFIEWVVDLSSVYPQGIYCAHVDAFALRHQEQEQQQEKENQRSPWWPWSILRPFRLRSSALYGSIENRRPSRIHLARSHPWAPNTETNVEFGTRWKVVVSTMLLVDAGSYTLQLVCRGWRNGGMDGRDMVLAESQRFFHLPPSSSGDIPTPFMGSGKGSNERDGFPVFGGSQSTESGGMYYTMGRLDDVSVYDERDLQCPVTLESPVVPVSDGVHTYDACALLKYTVATTRSTSPCGLEWPKTVEQFQPNLHHWLKTLRLQSNAPKSEGTGNHGPEMERKKIATARIRHHDMFAPIQRVVDIALSLTEETDETPNVEQDEDRLLPAITHVIAESVYFDRIHNQDAVSFIRRVRRIHGSRVAASFIQHEGTRTYYSGRYKHLMRQLGGYGWRILGLCGVSALLVEELKRFLLALFRPFMVYHDGMPSQSPFFVIADTTGTPWWRNACVPVNFTALVFLHMSFSWNMLNGLVREIRWLKQKHNDAQTKMDRMLRLLDISCLLETSREHGWNN